MKKSQTAAFAIIIPMPHAIQDKRESQALRFLRAQQTPLLVLLILLSVPLRLLWINRSLWIDESWVANSLAKPTIHGMLFYDRWAQSTPALFLFAERAIVNTLGMNEITLRLLPVVASFAAGLFFVYAIRRLFSFPVLAAGVTLFAFNYWAIRYGAEAKQYGTDIFASAVMLYLCGRERLTPRRAHYLIAAFVLLSWLSYPVTFWLPSLLLLIWTGISESRRARGLILLNALLIAGASILIQRFLLIEPNRPELLKQFWRDFDAYLSFATPLKSGIGLFNSLGQMFVPIQGRIGICIATLVVAALVLGVARMVRLLSLNRPLAIRLLACGPIPLMAGLCASLLGLYPVLHAPRLLVWILPCVCLTACCALEAIYQKCSRQANRQPANQMAHRTTSQLLPAGVFLLACAFIVVGSWVVLPRYAGTFEEQNRLLYTSLQRTWKSDNCLFVQPVASEQFLFYTRLLNWHPACVYYANTQWNCCTVNQASRATTPAATTAGEDVDSALHVYPRKIFVVLSAEDIHATPDPSRRSLGNRLKAAFSQHGCSLKPIESYGWIDMQTFDCRDIRSPRL